MPYQYGQVWLYILGHDRFTYGEISRNYHIAKSQVKAIVEWGLSTLTKHKIDFEFSTSRDGCMFKYTTKSYQVDSLVIEIVDYLNLKSGKKFNPKGKDTDKYIKARLKEGYKIEDFKKVIDNKVIKWLGTNMEDYLRPITLFGNKFNSYLNENGKSNSKSQIQRTIETATDISTSVDWGLDS